MKRKMSWKASLLLCLYSSYYSIALPVRIASNGIDSVVLTPEGGKDTVVIDTNKNLHVERLDAPIERIEIRLIDENSTAPLVIDISKGLKDIHATTTLPPDAIHPTNGDSHTEIIDAEKPIETVPKSDHERFVHIVIEPESTTSTTTTSATDILNGEQIVTRIPAHDEETQTTHATAVHEEFQEEARPSTHESPTPSTTLIAEENREVVDRYIDDLPHIEDIDDEDDNQNDEVLPVEECLDNKDKLSMETVQRLLRQRRRLSSLIKRLNKQQNMFCRPDQQMEHVEYRKCPLWKEEKMVHYYKLMRLNYCSDYTKWPDAPKIKRTFGPDFPLFEKLYAFTQKQ
uniref:Uncharacterized protein n=1 Tax=Acrobeloides nanus TaxID=290746 RepID=A0A914CTQ8_9BILA